MPSDLRHDRFAPSLLGRDEVRCFLVGPPRPVEFPPVTAPRGVGRLAVFVPTMSGGGAQRSTLTLAGGIAHRGYDVDLVLSRVEGPYVDDVPSAVRIVDLGARRVLTSVVPLARYLRKCRPDAMLSVMNYANIAALWAARLSGVATRVVVSERVHVSAKPWTRRRWLIVRLMRRAYPSAHAVVAVSNGVRDDLARLIGMPRERLHTIYNPVMRAELRTRAEAPPAHTWLVPGAEPVVLGVGRLTPQKDFATLCRAFARVRRARRVRLIILGEGPERPSLEALVRSVGCEADVSLPGFVQNPYAYMRRASLFVLSSRVEGLPAVLIEALCCGVPVVSTDCPSGPREILRDGKFGRLVPMGDVEAMTEAIEKGLVSGPGAAAPPESWQPFEVETVVSQYLDLLFPARGAALRDPVVEPAGPDAL